MLNFLLTLNKYEVFKTLCQTDRILNSKGMTYETTVHYGRGIRTHKTRCQN